jgi:hypothetical protein
MAAANVDGWSEEKHEEHVENVIRVSQRMRDLGGRTYGRNVLSRESAVEPGVGAVKRIFGIGPAIGRMPTSRLVHPDSPFHMVRCDIRAPALRVLRVYAPRRED